jgi:hypothetical protein
MSAALDFQGDPAATKAQSKLFVLQPVRRFGRARPPLPPEEINNAIERSRHARQGVQQVNEAVKRAWCGWRRPPVEEALLLFRFQSSLACMSGEPSSPLSQPSTLAPDLSMSIDRLERWTRAARRFPRRSLFGRAVATGRRCVAGSTSDMAPYVPRHQPRPVLEAAHARLAKPKPPPSS